MFTASGCCWRVAFCFEDLACSAERMSFQHVVGSVNEFSMNEFVAASEIAELYKDTLPYELHSKQNCSVAWHSPETEYQKSLLSYLSKYPPIRFFPTTSARIPCEWLIGLLPKSEVPGLSEVRSAGKVFFAEERGLCIMYYCDRQKTSPSSIPLKQRFYAEASRW